MIIFRKGLNSFWAMVKVHYKSNGNKLYVVDNIRLLSTEVEVLPKKMIRSMKKKKSRHLDAFGLVMLTIPVSAFGLGTWQIQRKMWKEELIKDLEKKTDLAPVDLPENLDDLKEMEYHPVRVRGKFDHSREIYMGPRSYIFQNKGYSKTSSLLSTSSSGYLVLTPFTLSDRNLTILVNRGWVPSQQKSPATRASGQITDEVELVGLVRNSESRQPLGMKNFPEKKLWLYRDLKTMSEVTGAQPVLIDAVASSTTPGGPFGGQTIVGLRNEHFSYIVTWYALAAVTAYMWYTRYFR